MLRPSGVLRRDCLTILMGLVAYFSLIYSHLNRKLKTFTDVSEYTHVYNLIEYKVKYQSLSVKLTQFSLTLPQQSQSDFKSFAIYVCQTQSVPNMDASMSHLQSLSLYLFFRIKCIQSE